MALELFESHPSTTQIDAIISDEAIEAALIPLGTKADATGTGAVADTKTAMTYAKQLVTELQVVDGIVDDLNTDLGEPGDAHSVATVFGQFDLLKDNIAAIPTTAMRGTDGAALAATALTNATWTDARAGYLDKLPVMTSDLSTGTTYYVNGDVVSSGAGTTWATAFKTVAEAVTASEAARGASFIRNRIYIQGIATVYAGISALPNYCDVMGIGANPNGNGTGICAIGGVSTVSAVAGSARGLNFYNIQFQANNDGTWCGDFVNLFRSGFYNCNFMNIGYQNDGGLRFTGPSGGITIKDCHWSSGTSGCFHEIGIQVSGTHWNDCVIENCEIGGTTAGVVIDDTCVMSAETVFKNNVIGDLGRGCVKGFDDNTADGYIVLHNNTIIATTGVERNVTIRSYSLMEREVHDIESHLHGKERWFGISASQAGTDWALETSFTGFVATSGDNAWGGATATDYAKIFGTSDTPNATGADWFDVHKIKITANDSATMYRCRFIWGTGTVEEAITAGQYSEFMYIKDVADKYRQTLDIMMPKIAAGTQLWFNVWNATDDATMTIFVGTHEYID
ncbi:MAG: hypothetical protein IMZ61_06700 [Planctomycetes bacterium]|nr:hypothetical protein [Planctomycetota bacterium]